MVGSELRPGSQHCQNGTPEFIRETMRVLDEACGCESKKLFRFDSGNDSDENIAEFKGRKKYYFIIKRNLRGEFLEGWLEIAKENGKLKEPHPGKKEWFGDIFREVKGYGQTRVVFKLVEKTMDRNGQAFLMPEIEVETYWTRAFPTIRKSSSSFIMRTAVRNSFTAS